MRNTVQRDIHQDLDRDPTRELFQWSASRSWAMDVMDLRKECRCIVYVIALRSSRRDHETTTGQRSS